MKLAYLLLIILTLGCQRQSKLELPETSKVAEVKVNPNHIKEDSIEIDIGYEKRIYPKDSINKIIDEHPEFFKEYIKDPEFEYWNNIGDFGSESGQDQYYVLYYYFLKQRNPSKLDDVKRKRLIELFHTYNSLYRGISYSCTGFGHQYERIYGIAEYIVYWSKDYDNSDEKYSFTKQKKLYIKLLKQMVAEEVEVDENLFGPEEISKIQKAEKRKYLYSIVDRIDSLSTDWFYLRRGQEFNYNSY